MHAEGGHTDRRPGRNGVLSVAQLLVRRDSADARGDAEGEAVGFGDHGAEIGELLKLGPRCGAGQGLEFGAQTLHEGRVGEEVVVRDGDGFGGRFGAGHDEEGAFLL